MKNVFLTMLVMCLVGAAGADYYLNVDEDLNVGAGYINVYSADGTTWVQGFAYPNADLRATTTGSTAGGDFQALLQANTLLYTANKTNPFWVDQTTLLGAKQPEANYYHEKDGLDGQPIEFEFRVLSNNLTAAGYECRGFIKVLDAGGNWATTTYEYTDLTVGTHTLNIPGSAVTGADPRVQAGFSVKGLNVNTTDPVAALGIVVVPYYSKAVYPNPADGANVGLDTTSLSWTNANPKNLSDTIACNVYFEVDDGDPNFFGGPIATGITDGTIALADYSITLADNTTYSWRVDCIDPNTGGAPVTLIGDLWTFTVTDVPPVVNAGLNQYVYLSGGTAAFTLSGSYTDDGKSTITRAEFVQGTHEKAPETVVTYGAKVWTPGAGIHTSGTVTQAITVDGNGWFAFNLEVEDGAGIGTDVGGNYTPGTPNNEAGVRAGVYGTCAEAATEDPADTYDATGDLNGDCKKNLADLSLFAAGWLDCDSAKTSCP
jgi:hypothetical protein